MLIKEQFITDEHGKKIGVFLSIEAYRMLLDQIEELADIKAYDEAVTHDDEEIPFEAAILEIEQNHS